MGLLPSFALLIVGIIVLIVAGDLLVRGAAALARHWGIPALIVGLTIVAFGTSAPELVVSIQAVMVGAGELASGNVVGSNIANVLLALGLPAILMAVPTNMPGVGRNALIAMFATLLFILLAWLGNPLTVWQGAILFGGIVIYLVYMARLAKQGAEDPILAEMTEIDEGELGLPTNVLYSGIFVVIGLIGLAFGGHLIVENAVNIAGTLGVSETIIGLTIVAIGTSLPEVATVIVAAYRGHSEVAIGNVLGSNIFNLFAVMGAASLAGPVAINPTLFVFDFWVMLATMVVLLVFVMRRIPIGRLAGIAFMVAYALYLAALVAGAM
ncbi:calcium/sodium antiporter [Fretibacter rubidus]|uniref:calcium/sodium antiporter n=1 Tax=Fretibacter rubidus TaxID=570162 RepID=UPI00352A9BAE